MRNVLILLALSLICVSLAACKDKGGENNVPADKGDGGKDSPAAKGEIPIGVFLSLSGKNADFGITTKNGIELAVEEINATGGINGAKIKLISKDTRSVPEEAGTVARQLVQEKVVCALGSVESGQSMNAAPIFQEAGIPMVTPSSTNPQVTKLGDRIFRVCYLDDFQGAACALFAQRDLRCFKASILYQQDDAYSSGLAQFFKAKFEKLGGKIVGEPQTYRDKATDFSTQVSNIKQQNPEIIFVPVYYGDVGLIAKEFRKQGVTVPLLGGDGWESPQLVKLGGTALEGCFFGFHYDPDDKEPRVQNYIKNYTKRWSTEPNSLSALGYDAVFVVKAAIERGGAATPDKITTALRDTRDFPGVTGTFSLDANRDARKPISMLKIGDNKLTVSIVIKPSEVE